MTDPIGANVVVDFILIRLVDRKHTIGTTMKKGYEYLLVGPHAYIKLVELLIKSK